MSDELTDEEIKAANYNTGVSDPALHLPVPPRRWWKAFQPMIATRLATARNDALEEAKDVALDILAQDQDRFAAAKEIIAAIETLKSEEKP